MRYITIALAKGRLAEKTMELFYKCGLPFWDINNTRKLNFVDEEKKIKMFLSKPADVPTYVERGAADIGIAGKDTLLEDDSSVYEMLDLGFGRCRIVVAGPPEAYKKFQGSHNLKVATKYPNIATDYFFRQNHRTVEIIKLNGSIELAPAVGLSDVIVDIVETGTTLKENGLEVFEEISLSSARVIVNRVSMKMEHERIINIIESLEKAVKEAKK